jgi:hypothetical protein
LSRDDVLGSHLLEAVYAVAQIKRVRRIELAKTQRTASRLMNAIVSLRIRANHESIELPAQLGDCLFDVADRVGNEAAHLIRSWRMMKQRELSDAKSARGDARGIRLIDGVASHGDEVVQVIARGNLEMLAATFLHQDPVEKWKTHQRACHGSNRLQRLLIVCNGRIGERQLREGSVVQHVGDTGDQVLVEHPGNGGNAAAVVVRNSDRRRSVSLRAFASVGKQIVLQRAHGFRSAISEVTMCNEPVLID